MKHSEMLNGKQVTLGEVLLSKEIRQNKQLQLLGQHDGVLIYLSLVTPGNIKNNYGFRYIFYRALLDFEKQCIEQRFSIICHGRVIETTGLEAYWVVKTEDVNCIKKLCIELEEQMIYGRLCDFDVIIGNEMNHHIVSRSDLNLSGRKCLVCGSLAHACARSQKHSYADVLASINVIIYQSIQNTLAT